ncbi:MAG: SprT-like domain-containing protein [Ruminococcus sp.]|uniref:SprT-like domain-containing protein n=1 Tax=Ruminococcus sp. TaxID=41978 RepID=UPI0025E6993A|nr:SprT-like domain-containing protein [Ruminococcus sp.]MCR5599120.1 SprT-like domain-containing protein [Ruminococcus sp.]
MCKKRKIYTMSELNLAFMKMFNLFNEHYFENKLPKVIITFESGYKKGAFGWIYTKPTWEQSRQERYNINISSDFLDRDIYAVMATLLHEMCHLYALENGIKDTSRAGIYHNKKFKEIAESHGLEVFEEDKIGFGRTKPTDEMKGFVDSNSGVISFEVKKLRPVEKDGGEEKPKQSRRKYVCPCCGQQITATKEVQVMCGICYSPDVEPVFMVEC